MSRHTKIEFFRDKKILKSFINVKLT